jgi:hypothetical protein
MALLFEISDAIRKPVDVRTVIPASGSVNARPPGATGCGETPVTLTASRTDA